MRLAWATDIHLDFVDDEGLDGFCRGVVATGADRLVVSGDIAVSKTLVESLSSLAGRIGRPIDFVLGNHDFYGSRISEVRAEAEALSRSSGLLGWLPASGVVPLGEGVALLGHDGWGDGRLGDFARSTIRLNDYRLIGDLAGLDREALGGRLAALGDEAAAFVRETLPRALEVHEAAVFVTHVPPFREACVHRGRFADDDWLPHFSCGAVGEALVEVMAARPGRRLLVLCGHVHCAGTARILPNLVVETGPAEYRYPEVVRVVSIPEDLAPGGPQWC